MAKIDIASAPKRLGTGYPPPFDAPCRLRERLKLGDAAGLDQFGVNLLRLPAGQWSSQRHWHTNEDEFVWVLEGEAVLVTDAGEEVLRPGDCAGFKAGVADGHCLQNRTDRDVLLLEIGSRRDKEPDYGCDYPDIDMAIHSGRPGFRRKDGTPY